MRIQIKKFGTMLISRPAGREAACIILSSFNPSTQAEAVELDFTDVDVIAPGWLDEVMSALRKVYGDRVICLDSGNSSLRESMKTIDGNDPDS